MKKQLIQELIQEITIEDIPENHRPVAEIIGIEKFLQINEYAKGDELYFPKAENIITPARNRKIYREYNGYNIKELAIKYNLTTKQIYNIIKTLSKPKPKPKTTLESKPEPTPEPKQISIFDFPEIINKT